jgi:hypothetical protein
MNGMTNYSFFITEGQNTQQILLGHGPGVCVFVTQKIEFRSRDAFMRPGALLSVRHAGHDYTLLVFHLASMPDPRGFGLRQDMIDRAFKFKAEIVDQQPPAERNFILLGDLRWGSSISTANPAGPAARCCATEPAPRTRSAASPSKPPRTVCACSARHTITPVATTTTAATSTTSSPPATCSSLSSRQRGRRPRLAAAAQRARPNANGQPSSSYCCRLQLVAARCSLSKGIFGSRASRRLATRLSVDDRSRGCCGGGDGHRILDAAFAVSQVPGAVRVFSGERRVRATPEQNRVHPAEGTA